VNLYQQLGAFLFRLAGCVLPAVGLAGLLYVVVLLLAGQDISIYPTGRGVASVLWVLLGFTVILVSNPLGRLVGKGLE
jgi:hypothetical protein